MGQELEQQIGYCKECGAEVSKADEIKDYPGIFECPTCKHPHTQNELWEVVPDYLVK